MAIRTVITAGYGNGTFNGTIKDVTVRGYSIGIALAIQIYLANVFCNISPTRNMRFNISPTEELKSNISPTEEVYSG